MGFFVEKEAEAARSEDLDVKRVLLARGDPLCLQRHRKPFAGVRIEGIAQQCGVVPGFAGDHGAFAVGALLDDIRKDRADGLRYPAGAEGNVADVHSQVAHAAVLAVEFDHSFPVDRFVRVEVAGVEEAGLHLDDSPERASSIIRPIRWSAGKKGNSEEHRTKTSAWRADASEDRIVGRLVDTERLLAHQVLACLDGSAVELLVQMVRHGDVDGLHVGIRQQLPIVVGHLSQWNRSGLCTTRCVGAWYCRPRRFPA